MLHKSEMVKVAAALFAAMAILSSCSAEHGDNNQLLLAAAWEGDLTQVQGLLEKGADVNL